MLKEGVGIAQTNDLCISVYMTFKDDTVPIGFVYEIFTYIYLH